MPIDGVGDALGQKRQHDEPRHDEGAVAHPADFADARADRRPEHDEIERGRDHRRRHALPDRALRALKLVAVDRPDAVEIDRRGTSHAARPTRSTKMSSSVRGRGVQILEIDADLAEPAQKRRHAGVLGRRIEAVGKPPAVVLEFERPAGEFLGQRRQRLVQRQRQAPFAELAHQRRFIVDQHDPAVVDDADPVRHLLGLLDVMGGQDDGDALGAQPPDQRPHVAAQVDVDASGRLVEEQHVGLVAQRLGDHRPPLHAARQFDDSVCRACPTAKGRAAAAR